MVTGTVELELSYTHVRHDKIWEDIETNNIGHSLLLLCILGQQASLELFGLLVYLLLVGFGSKLVEQLQCD